MKETEKKCLEKDMEELENAADDVMKTTQKEDSERRGLKFGSILQRNQGSNSTENTVR